VISFFNANIDHLSQPITHIGQRVAIASTFGHYLINSSVDGLNGTSARNVCAAGECHLSAFHRGDPTNVNLSLTRQRLIRRSRRLNG
jgi:hypothetical protein